MVPESRPQAYPQALWMIRHIDDANSRHFHASCKGALARSAQPSGSGFFPRGRFEELRDSNRFDRATYSFVSAAGSAH
jgi:hypothetical protein